METALDKLKKMTAWASDPTLTEDELEDLLEATAMPDGEGNLPESEGWDPTYDLNKAASDGWLIKAGRASELVEVDPPGSGLFASKVFDNCRAMARIYSTRRAAAAKVEV